MRLGPRPAAYSLWVALAIVALVTALRISGTVDSDVAWQLWIAGRIHAGANLYTDIIETNPPLWFWMGLPVERVATFLDLRIEAVLVVIIGLLSAASLAATDRLIERRSRGRTLLLGYCALILTAMPWAHVGQREQLVLIAVLPYTALVAARRDGRPISPALAASIGIGAALGFSLKHYFLLTPALLELWLLAARKNDWRPFRPETIAVAGVGAAYALAILALEPDFLGNIVPLIRLAYGAYGPPSVRYLFGPFALLAMVTTLIAAIAIRRPFAAKESGPAALLLAAIGFGAAYFIQFKGWTYHALPALGCASIALFALLVKGQVRPRFLSVAAPALLAMPFLLAADEQRYPALPSPDLLGAIDGLHPEDSIGFLTTETAIPWSVTLQRHYRYASRYNGYWMLPAIVDNEARRIPDPRLEAIGRRVVAETVADFICIPPKRIIVWRPQPRQGGFDILPFFLRDPAFAALLAHYRARSRTSLQTFELTSPLPASKGACRRGV